MIGVNLTHERLADELLAQTRAADGLAPVDLDQFWADDAQAKRDPFADDCPQVPCGVMMSGEVVWDELGIAEDWLRYEHDAAYRVSLHRAYNDKAHAIVGKRLLSEDLPDPHRKYPPTRDLADIFEARKEWHGWSYWIVESAHDEHELARLLDRVEKRLERLREFILPDNWAAEKDRLTKLGVRPPLYRSQRGPVTFATSVYGTENLLLLILDNPALADRFRDVIQGAILARAKVLDDEAGWSPDCAWGRGFGFADDNCALMAPEMYEGFGYPVLKALFDRYAPRPTDWRYQHSDSAMAHLLPILGRLDFSAVNFGPTVLVEQIRPQMPRTVIQGCLAPFTLSRNEERNIVLEFLRDFEQARSHKGLHFATAGSINNGSRLTGMRLVMSAIQQFGRYRG